MSKHFTITIPSNSSSGPYTIFYDFQNSGYVSLIYNTPNFAENLSLGLLTTGLTVTVPDSAQTLIIYNASECDSSQTIQLPEPVVTFPQLCFKYFCDGSPIISTLTWTGNYVNGKPSWTGSTTSGDIELNWITGSTPEYWAILNLPFTVIRTYDTSTPPLTGWFELLGFCTSSSVSMQEGPCGLIITPPVIDVVVTDPTDIFQRNGGFSINTQGGNPPFLYSLDGITYSPTPVFTNLGVGTYNVYLRDSSGNTFGELVTITAPQPTTNTLRILQSQFTPIGSTVNNTRTFKLDYVLQMDNPLPSGSYVDFGLTINYNKNYYSPGTALFVTTGNTLFKNGSTLLFNPTSNPFVQTSPSPCNPLFGLYQGQDSYYRNSIYQNGDIFVGSCVFSVDAKTSGSTSGSCYTDLQLDLSLQTTIISASCTTCFVTGDFLTKQINLNYYS